MWDTEILQWAKSCDKLIKVSAHNFEVYCRNIRSGRPIAEDNRGRERCLRLFNSRYARKSSSCHRCREEEQQNRETKKRNDRNRPGEGRVASQRLSLESRSKKSAWPATTRYIAIALGNVPRSVTDVDFIAKVVQRLLRGWKSASGVLQTPISSPARPTTLQNVALT